MYTRIFQDTDTPLDGLAGTCESNGTGVEFETICNHARDRPLPFLLYALFNALVSPSGVLQSGPVPADFLGTWVPLSSSNMYK